MMGDMQKSPVCAYAISNTHFVQLKQQNKLKLNTFELTISAIWLRKKTTLIPI